MNEAPALNLTPDEKRVYGQLFRQADTDGVGVVTGETAVKFFEKTRLDQRVLGEVCRAPRAAVADLYNPSRPVTDVRRVCRYGKSPTARIGGS